MRANPDIPPNLPSDPPSAVAFDVAEAVQAAAAGSQASWDLLVQRYAGTVWGAAIQLGLDEDAAAGVSRVTWLRLADHLVLFREPEALVDWLTATAHREAVRVVMLSGPAGRRSGLPG